MLPLLNSDQLSLTTHPFWRADVVEDSVGPHRVRLTTFALRFPRSILDEFNTHRMFSRNASSRRAIPISISVRIASETPYFPDFRKNQKGMAAGERLGADEMKKAHAVWLEAQQAMISAAVALGELGVQKSWPGWLLEPFSFVDVVATSTEWKNFFRQRNHSSAQPEMERIAAMMNKAYLLSLPTPRKWGEWHLPFIKKEDEDQFTLAQLKQISAARCARVSYTNHEGQRDPQQDIELYHRLIASEILHASPFEHQASPVNWRDGDEIAFVGNLRGWFQQRKELRGEDGN